MARSRVDAITAHTYDGHGNRIGTTRPLGTDYRWVYDYDAAHRLQTVTSPEGAVTTYGYDRADRRTRVTDAEDRETVTAYDALGRPTRVEFADGEAETIDAYDENGNVLARRDANGQTISSTYDEFNRLTQRSYGGNAQPRDIVQETWTYDANGQPMRIEQVQDDATRHITTRAWDRQGRRDEESDRYAQTTDHEYDAQSNRTARLDASGRTVYQHDRLNRLRAVQPAGEGAMAIDYTPAGRLWRQTLPNGATTEHAYDAAGRLATITHRQHGTVVATLSYAYDRNGNRASETQVSAAGTRLTTYAYDRDDRLRRSEITDEAGVVTTTETTLDAVGNRRTEVVTRAGTLVANRTYDYSARHQLDTVTDAIDGVTTTRTFDANGFQTGETRNGQTTTYRPNLQDRLATLTTPTGPPVDYAYDADGLRVEKRTGGEAIRYGYDGAQLRRETNVTNNLLASYDWAHGRILSSQRSSATAYAQHDALKSPIRWSRADGGEQGRASFDAWGTALSQSGDLPPIGYTGYYADSESSLYYAQQRYYAPTLGRFNRIDPWQGDTLNPITLNKYLYANGNPLTFTDPTGLCGDLGDMSECAFLYAAVTGDTNQIETQSRANELTAEFTTGIAVAGVEGAIGTAQQAILAQRAQMGDPRAIGELWGQGEGLVDMALHPGRTYREAVTSYSDQISRIDELSAQGDEKGAFRQRGKVVAPFVYAVASIFRLPKALDAGTPSKPVVVTEGGIASPGYRFYDDAMIDDLDAAYRAAAQGIDPDYGSGKGRRGTRETREHIDIVRDQFLDENPEYRHIAGGTDRLTGAQLPEEYIRGASGGRLGSSFSDLTFAAPDGSRMRINTVDTDDLGVMSPREQRNFDRIFEQTGEPIIAVPKPTPIQRRRP